MKYSLAIIGGGPAGYNAAEIAGASGLKTIIFEKNKVGGVCLNEGCIPTKTLLYSAKLYDNAKNSAKYGVDIEGSVSFDWNKIQKRKTKVVRKLVAGIKTKLQIDTVTLIEGEASLLEKQNGNFVIECNGETFIAEKILICTGSEVAIPPIKGVESTEFWTSREALETKEIPTKIVIIGGGVIGMEFAALFNTLGAEVVVVEMLSEILGANDKEISAMLRDEYTKRGVKFLLNTKVKAISNNCVTIENEDGEKNIDTEKILISTGRKTILPNGVKELGLINERGNIVVDNKMCSSIPDIYAAGDVTGYYQLAHVAIREGEVVINNILGKYDEMHYDAIPSVVYTNPEIAGVGETEDTLNRKNKPFKVYKLPLAFSGRFVAENEGVNGLCKIITDENNVVIGCHMIGNPSSEIIVFATASIRNKETVEQMKKHIYPHPTVGEIIHEVLNIIH